eukprot:TRINITY_DN9758_c0_g1_i5.p2 TRINITY_DN9758_c0_g1~~TRINITY_DN9758_c0_g1_i5.p2  ORF type:complete len:150 (+),score=27.67 TRINITY_DN9758_c0_g1_i5:288-737(+)
MSGEAMHQQGYTNLYGCDISCVSLAQLRKTRPGVYTHVEEVDMEVTPYPFEDAFFAGFICVGVLSSVQNIEATFREWLRLAKPRAKFAFSHRDDLLVKDCDECRPSMDKLSLEGLWKKLHESEPTDYLPDAPSEIQRVLKIRTFVFEKL